MNVFLLVLSHLACFVGGAFMWHWITKTEAARLRIGDPDDPDRRRESRGPTPGAIILVAAAFLITMGVQQWFFQRDQTKEDERQDDLNACVATWGTDVTETFRARSDATTDLEAARERRDDAVDAILAVVLAFQEEPPEATAKDFADSLDAWVKAKADLVQVQAEVEDTRDQNPFPVLDC